METQTCSRRPLLTLSSTADLIEAVRCSAVTVPERTKGQKGKYEARSFNGTCHAVLSANWLGLGIPSPSCRWIRRVATTTSLGRVRRIARSASTLCCPVACLGWIRRWISPCSWICWRIASSTCLWLRWIGRIALLGPWIAPTLGLHGVGQPCWLFWLGIHGWLFAECHNAYLYKPNLQRNTFIDLFKIIRILPGQIVDVPTRGDMEDRSFRQHPHAYSLSPK